uniref:Uncharacterized protein n=1 Tax=Clastoptera arizonana TaxID=38151 RepID=A0A1B6BXQ6_9HEMI
MSKSKDTVSSKNVSSRVNVHNLRTVINKRKFDDDDNKVTTKGQNLNTMKTSNLFFPDLLAPFVCQKSVQNVLKIIGGSDCTTLEEIKSAKKINLVFEVCEMKLFPENDVLILKIRDGTICPKCLLSIPLLENWAQLQEKVLYNPVYISDQPIVELVVYNSSFTSNLKERNVFSMKNIMIVETAKNKGLMLCVNGRDTRIFKLRSNSECMKIILRRTSTSSYHKAEEEHLKKIIYLYSVCYNIRWNSGHNNSSIKSQENLKSDKENKSVENRKLEKSAVLSELSSEKSDSDGEKMSIEHFKQNITIRKKNLKKRCSSSESVTESSSESFKLINNNKTRNKIASEEKMNSNRKHLSNLKSSKNLDTKDSMKKVKKLKNGSQVDSKSSSDTSFNEFINSSSSEAVSTLLQVSEIEDNTTNTNKMYKSDCVMLPKKHNSLRSSRKRNKLLSSSSEESFESNDVPRIEKNYFSKSENNYRSIKKKTMKKLLFEDDFEVDSQNKSITGIKIKSTDKHNCSKFKKIQSTEASYKENENSIKNHKTEEGANVVNIENQVTSISLLNINNQNKLSTSNDDLLPSTTSSLKSVNKSENVEEIETTPLHLDSEESWKNDLIVNNDERRKTKNVEENHFDSSSTDSFFKKCTKSRKNQNEKTKENFDCGGKNKLKIGDDDNDVNAENNDPGISLRRSNRNDSTSNTSLTVQTINSPSCLEKKHKNSKVDANTSLTPQTSISPSDLENKHSKEDVNTSITSETSNSSSQKRNKHENSKVELVSTDSQSNYSSDKYLKISSQIVNTRKQRPVCVVSDKSNTTDIKLDETDLEDKSNKEKKGNTKENLQLQHLLNKSNMGKKDTTTRSKVIVQINDEEMCSEVSENNSHRVGPNECLKNDQQPETNEPQTKGPGYSSNNQGNSIQSQQTSGDLEGEKSLTNKDECSMFLEMISTKLRKLTPCHQSTAMNKMLNVIYELEMMEMGVSINNAQSTDTHSSNKKPTPPHSSGENTSQSDRGEVQLCLRLNLDVKK